MNFFDKPMSLMPVNPDSIKEQTVYRARQALDWDGNQNPSLSFSIYWLSLVRESYRQAQKKHPKSTVKRAMYLNKQYPYGQSLYRNASRFFRWYLQRTEGLLIGDPTGNYFQPINTNDEALISPHPQPNALADTFTLTLLRYYMKPPAIRLTRKETGYGFIKMSVPSYVTLSQIEKHKWNKNKQTQISGYLTDEIIKEFIRSEIGIYLKQYENSMDERYVRLLKEKVGIYL